MEIRRLQIYEAPWAVQFAREMYEQCVRPQTTDWTADAEFYRYISLEHIQGEMSRGRLTLYGAFDRGWLCGVSALQGNGHVSILFVRPEYQHLDVDNALKRHMERCAQDVLGLSAVRYPARRVPGRVAFGVAAAALLFAIALYAGVTMYHITVDGLITESIYTERQK